MVLESLKRQKENELWMQNKDVGKHFTRKISVRTFGDGNGL